MNHILTQNAALTMSSREIAELCDKRHDHVMRDVRTMFTELGKITDPSFGGSATSELGFQDRVSAGYLEHKMTAVPRSDGTEKYVTQVRVTPKGIARLAKELGGKQSEAA